MTYSGVDADGRNGVALVLNKKLQEMVVECVRVNDSIIKIKVLDQEMKLNSISAYAPQRGCLVEEKEFWGQMDSLITATPEDERKMLGGNLNGHTGQCNTNIQRVNGGLSLIHI